MYVLVPLLLVEILSYVWSSDQSSAVATLISALALLDDQILGATRHGALRRSGPASAIAKSIHTDLYWDRHCDAVNTGS